jgi:hypothetical protein
VQQTLQHWQKDPDLDSVGGAKALVQLPEAERAAWQQLFALAEPSAGTATGQGEDAAKLQDKERARLRQQALGWLRADLALWTKQLGSGQAADRAEMQRVLRHWQKDTDLESVRAAKALAALPPAERASWQQLWADIEKLLKKGAP